MGEQCFKPVTYFKRYGFSINEGGGPINITVLWGWKQFRFFFYLYAFGQRVSFCLKRRPA